MTNTNSNMVVYMITLNSNVQKFLQLQHASETGVLLATKDIM